LREAPEKRYVGRGALKLEHALAAFHLDVSGWRCADFGASTGGFTDCLLQHGARQVVAVDTGYGVLDYRLRTDPRVQVRERTNALHTEPPAEPVQLVVADLGWTRQERLVPVALGWLPGAPDPSPAGRILTLIKPHYEVTEEEKALLDRGILPEAEAERIHHRVLDSLPALGVQVLGETRSPIRGGGSRSGGPGNVEYLALLAPVPRDGVGACCE
jgi:23S rRNA (cytidine1920-2'-O)/16S rRNA (cytidine1409-2'-O)-methyltransferase